MSLPWQSSFAFVAVLLILCFGLFPSVLTGLWRFVTRRGLEPSFEWFEHFDLDRYKVLPRLLSQEDFVFLRSQPGFQPELAARLRADRLRIAEGYLRQLENDVRLLLNFANQTAGAADSKEQDISAFLLKQELAFAWSLMRARLQLSLMRVGLLREVRLGGLLDGIRPLVLHSRTLAPAFF